MTLTLQPAADCSYYFRRCGLAAAAAAAAGDDEVDDIRK